MANKKSKDKGLSKAKKSKPVANRNQFDELITDCDQLVDDKDIIISQRDIEELILVIRGHQVLIDRDLAMIYGVETRSLNQAVKRNIRRFPERYRFQLTKDEMMELITNCDRFRTLKHSKTTPYAFTEFGV